MVDVRWALSPHVGRLTIEAMGRRAKVWMLGPSPGRVLIDPRVWHAVTRVVMRGSHVCKTKRCLQLAEKVVGALGRRREVERSAWGLNCSAMGAAKGTPARGLKGQ